MCEAAAEQVGMPLWKNHSDPWRPEVLSNVVDEGSGSVTL
jgi:hypothetical protein